VFLIRAPDSFANASNANYLFTIIPGPLQLRRHLSAPDSRPRNFSPAILPVKSGRRERELRAAAAREETSIYFESPYR